MFSERPLKELWPSTKNEGTIRGRRNASFCEDKRKKTQVFHSHGATVDVILCFKRNHSITVRLVGHSETKVAPLSRQMRKQLESSESTYQFLQV